MSRGNDTIGGFIFLIILLFGIWLLVTSRENSSFARYRTCIEICEKYKNNNCTKFCEEIKK